MPGVAASTLGPDVRAKRKSSGKKLGLRKMKYSPISD
jgi:hypothetical protein